MAEILFKEECFKIVGACMEVHNEMGSGFLEAVYQECLNHEFGSRDIPFEAQKELKLTFKNQMLQSTYRPDFVCFGKIIVEIKCIAELSQKSRAQVINYLRATKFKLGLLVNFGKQGRLDYERIVY